MLSLDEQQTLIDTAMQSIERKLKREKPITINLANYFENLTKHGCSFVTLKKNGELRGCIGSLQAEQPLICDVAEHAVAAAFEDSRFPPLTLQEFYLVELEISVLEPATAIRFHSEENLLQQITEGEDGLILEEGLNRATFLPSVWESLPDKLSFWHHLKLKAGLARHYWSDTLKVQRYRVQLFGNHRQNKIAIT